MKSVNKSRSVSSLCQKGKRGDVGRSGADNRLFINAIIWIARSGVWNSVYQRFPRWARSGYWKSIFEAWQDPHLDWRMLDSTVVRAHQQAAGQKKQCFRRSLRRESRGLTTKIHALVDALGNLLRILLTLGHWADRPQALPLLTDWSTLAVVADKAYDTNNIVQVISNQNINFVIPWTYYIVPDSE
jgi:transposase